MVQVYLIIALLTAGISLAMGSVSFFLGLKNQNKTDLIFGAMGLSLFLFLVLPPVGFIILDQSPYPFEILFKRVFIFGYYGLMPWFIYYYTGRSNKKPPIAISLGVLSVYIIMGTTVKDQPQPAWVWYALFIFGSNLFYGIYSGIKQFQDKDKESAIWFLIAIAAYGILFLLTCMNQFGIDLMKVVFNTKLFFSIHLHSLFLVLVMSFRMIIHIDERFRLEKIVQQKETRWLSLAHHAPVFIMELDKHGHIIHINNYGLNLLGYSDVGELIGRNWFEASLLGTEVATRKKLFLESITNQKPSHHFVRTIQNKRGDAIIITWTQFLTYLNDGEVKSMICIGIDTTGEESAKRLIDQLKLELEKEKISSSDDSTFSHSDEIIGQSEAIRYAIEKARQVSKTNAPVLLEGETGVGKELFANLIHKTSSRSNGPLVKVNCGALPKELIEDELFGHEKGAFTSAIQSRKGRFELADGGTIFLDELGELPLEMQPKLLRVLQNGEFERVGGQKTIKVDVRIIAATNRELQQEVYEGHFRDDLFYRLSVFPITIPSLKKRKEDLPLLINHFINLESKKYNKQLEQISKADMLRLLEHAWPGNVRELKNVIERSVIASEGNTLKLQWFVDQENETIGESTLEQIERKHIIKIMESCHWKINGENGAAEKLDMHPNTLRSKMKKLGIGRPVKNIS
jgi:formate hydrogenlyase transcriptional activator